MLVGGYCEVKPTGLSWAALIRYGSDRFVWIRDGRANPPDMTDLIASSMLRDDGMAFSFGTRSMYPDVGLGVVGMKTERKILPSLSVNSLVANPIV